MERDLTPDWILQQTLNVHNTALMSFLKGKQSEQNDGNGGGLTLTVLGCGTMGIAILGGILDSLSSSNAQEADPDAPKRLPNKFNACVRSLKGADRIKRELGQYERFKDVTIYQNDNVKPSQDADVILLGCKPYMIGPILKAEGMPEAVRGKLLISILAGVTEQSIQSSLPSADHSKVVRAMPNTAAAVRESMTVIATSTPPLEDETAALVDWMFTRPAFTALFLESLAAGAIAMGVPRDEAYLMAAQTARGTTQLMLKGGQNGAVEHPAVLRDKVSTPGGCTIGGLMVLEEGAVRGTVSRAVREATVVASRLGSGATAVNGPRP
ncbi:delta 1-pyrroline-5-carboxylate reductase [Elasticomyces elasticus]|nr:delta 1-pyrroline-5-carboxylate reductase [Elasticomyces elasticus]KAK3637270.1 delta 1-pyrroline-5-carboxylate reductase [Elasticomyces elasticus]KAK4916457.1 delta 1-pyrroline-5-carboxylate reductase [Elasticomyces elasticus]KAK5755996.1 delta 1-pyrroline-5-carboxylate reductase [Elasticomyces elasticus]